MKHATIIIYATVKVAMHVSTPSSQAHTTEKYTVGQWKNTQWTVQNCTVRHSEIAQLDSKKIRDKNCNLQCAAVLHKLPQ